MNKSACFSFNTKYIITIFFTTFFFIVQILAQPGTLDKSFGYGGKNLAASGTRNMALQADGKFVTIEGPRHGGWFFELARYNSNGLRDTSFGIYGIVTTSFRWTDTKGFGVTVQADGKIVATGCTAGDPFFYGTDFALARYLPNGTLDSSFGIDGKVITNYGSTSSEESFQSVTILSDGKILGGGYQYSSTGGFAVVRYNTNGSVDSTFGVNGLAIIHPTRGSSSVYTMGLLPDGRIVLGGRNDSYLTNFTMACFNSNGSVDSTFGEDGVVTTHFDTPSGIQYGAMVVQKDGKIVFKGSTNTGTVIIARFKSNGSYDQTFAQKGVLIEENSWIYLGALCIQKDYKIVSAGESSKSNNVNLLVVKRYKINGDIDSSFGNNGITKTQFDDAPDAYQYFTNSSVLQNNGDIVFGGNLLVRYYGDSSTIPLKVRIKNWLQHHGFSYQLTYNNDVCYYAVQRSSDGVLFKEITRIANFNNILSSSFNDKAPLNGNNYYRLAATIKDGAIVYSNIILVNETATIKLYPNPVKNNLQVQGLPFNSKSLISVVDINGNVLISATTSESIFFVNTSKFYSGSYFLKVQNNGNIVTLPFVKQHF